jgi:hypothetical protein
MRLPVTDGRDNYATEKFMGRSILCASALAFMLGAAMPASAYTVIGGGDCNKWVRENNPSDRTWLVGFISGMNAWFSQKTNSDPLAAVRSGVGIVAWVDDYCRANPQKPLEEAAYEVYLQTIPKLTK